MERGDGVQPGEWRRGAGPWGEEEGRVGEAESRSAVQLKTAEDHVVTSTSPPFLNRVRQRCSSTPGSEVAEAKL